MPRLVTRGRFTQAYVKGLLDAPEDRDAAVRKVIEAAGGKVISFYVTTGETDFLLISEANENGRRRREVAADKPKINFAYWRIR